MKDDLNPNSMEYYIVKSLAHKLEQDNTKLKDKLQDKSRVYLDDDIEILHHFVDLVDKLTDEVYDDAPNHLKGDLKELSTDDVRKILKDLRITTYGRAGMTLNTPELSKYLEN